MANDYLCMKEIEKTIHLALPLTYISKKKVGVLEILESWKRLYNQDMEGILISYKNVSILSENMTAYDKYCIQVNIKAKFNLFCPVVGSIVKGKINRISKEHVGCLVHDTINVVIKLKEYCPPELNKFIHLQQEILFEIVSFCVQTTEIRLKGKITPECLNLMNYLFPITNKEITNFSYQNQNSVTPYDFNDMELNWMDFKREKLSISSSSDNENKEKIQKLSKKINNSKENIIEELLGQKEENDIKRCLNGIELSDANKKRKRESTDDESNSQDMNLYSDGMNSSGKMKTKKPKLDISSSLNHNIKEKKRKKEKDDKKKLHKSKKNKKKSVIVASGEILKKTKKKHKRKHLDIDNDLNNKLEIKGNKKYSKKKKPKLINDKSIKSEL